MTGAPYSALAEPSLVVRAQVRRAIAEAEVAGRWASAAIEDTDRFDGPIGADNHGTITTYRTVEELQLAAETRALRSRPPGLFGAPRDPR